MQTFTGIWPALVTPSNPDNTVNLTVLRQLIDYLINKQVDGFYVGGTTGEGIFMPVAQRKLLLETALTHIDGRVPVIVHVGAVSVDDAVDLARHAQAHGAVGFSSIIPPMYTGLDSIIPYYRQLAAAAPELPFLAYILNPIVDSVELLKRLSDIPNMGGAKYTGPDMFELQRIIEMGAGQWTLFSGMDEECLYARMMGVTGAIGSTLNIMPGAYRQIHKLVDSNQHMKAQELQEKANRITALMIRLGFQGALKEILSRMLNAPVGNPLLPRVPLTDEQRQVFYAELEKTAFAELAAL